MHLIHIQDKDYNNLNLKTVWNLVIMFGKPKYYIHNIIINIFLVCYIGLYVYGCVCYVYS
jgi:hypothetical protein